MMMNVCAMNLNGFCVGFFFLLSLFFCCSSSSMEIIPHTVRSSQPLEFDVLGLEFRKLKFLSPTHNTRHTRDTKMSSTTTSTTPEEPPRIKAPPAVSIVQEARMVLKDEILKETEKL